MTAITSAGTGNWNTAATWSPAQVPVAADTVTVASGHTVTYDKDGSGIALGKVTINGTLTFSTSMSTVMEFDGTTTDVLSISSTGTLNIGTSGSPIPAVYTATLKFAGGSTTRSVINQASGSYVNIYGDNDYYGNLRKTTLNADWSSGASFYVDGDASTWRVGNKLYVNSNPGTAATSTSSQTDADFYEITAVGSYDAGNDRTQITCAKDGEGSSISNPVVSSKAGGLVINCSRNVIIYDASATNKWTVYGGYNGYTERCRITIGQASTYARVFIDNALIQGFDRGLDSGYNVYCQDIVFASNNYAINTANNYWVDGDFISNSYGVSSGVNIKLSGDFASNNIAISFGVSHQHNGDFVSNNISLSVGTNHLVDGDLVYSYYGVSSGVNIKLSGDCFYNAYAAYAVTNLQITGTLSGNTNNVASIANQGLIKSVIMDNCTVSSQNRALRYYCQAGNVLPVVSGDSQWVSPSSGADWILEAIPNSYCTDALINSGLIMPPHKPMSAYAEAGETTLTMRIYPYGTWGTELDNTDVVLRVKYRNGESGMAQAVNGTATYANGGWRDVSVTFTPTHAGAIYFTLEIYRYESGKTILIDPVWSIA